MGGGIPPYSTNPPYQRAPGLGMFERRIDRLGFILGFIYSFVVMAIPFLLELIIRITGLSGSIATVINIITILLGMGLIGLYTVVAISLDIRRLHDLNQPGALVLLAFVPLINFGLFIYLLFVPGTNGPNQYGPPINSHNIWVVLGFKKPTNVSV